MAPTDNPLRLRIISTAVELTSERGWSDVTMSRLAESVGVSRQSVYNEVGSKPKLAESMVALELERFLAAVDEELRAQGPLLVGIRNAAHRVFEMAEDDPLLRAILSSGHGGNSELLPLLMTSPGLVIDPATEALQARVLASYPVEVADETDLPLMCSAIVRMVVSYITQPSGSPEQSASEIVWMAERFLSDTQSTR